MEITLHNAAAAVRDIMRANLVSNLIGSPGIGKALANSELVLTPNGFVPMGNLKPGDTVIGVDGLPTNVNYTAPQGIRDIFTVTFRDGTSVKCDGDHLWKVKNRKRGSPWNLLTTRELLKRSLRTREPDNRTKNAGNTYRYNYQIPAISPVKLNESSTLKNAPLHPYILGQLLGDGCMARPTTMLITPNKTTLEKVESLLPTDYIYGIVQYRNGAYHIPIVKKNTKIKLTFKEFLIANNISCKLSIDKSIPNYYKYGSLELREELYNGLNDSDGVWKDNSLVGFDVSSKQLHIDYCFISRSLGNQLSASSRIPSYKDKTGTKVMCNISYRTFTIKNKGFNSIKSIEQTGKEYATCISVDNNSKLFITNGFKPTHNSDIVKQVAEEFDLKVIDIRLAQADPTDISGFPTLNEDRSRCHYAPPVTFPLAIDKLPIKVPETRKPMDPSTPGYVNGMTTVDTPAIYYKGWLLFLDELTSAPLMVQAAAYQLILDRQVGEHDLHEKVRIVCAGNKTTDKAIVQRMSTALQSRVVTLEVIIDLDEWLIWAEKANIDKRIMAYVQWRPDMLHKFNANHQDLTFPCPRTWEFASDLMKIWGVITIQNLIVLAGTISKGAASELIAFCQVYDSLPTLEKMIADPLGVPIDTSKKDLLFAICSLIGQSFNKDNSEALILVMERLPIEFRVTTCQNILRRDRTLRREPNLKIWIRDNSSELY